MDFFIKQNSRLPKLQTNLLGKIINGYQQSVDLSGTFVTFSMYDKKTGNFIIKNSEADISIDNENYVISYLFKEKETEMVGEFVGIFTIQNNEIFFKVPFRETLIVTILESVSDLSFCCRPNRTIISISPSITITPSITSTPSNTVTPSITVTPSNTVTPSITVTPSNTVTPSITVTPSNTVTPSITSTPSNTVTPSITSTPSNTVTPSITVTPSNSVTPSLTPSISTSPSTSGIVTDNLFMNLDASTYVSGTWNDLTGNGNNATINGAIWTSTDGGIFDLDGVNDNIQISHNLSLSLSTTIQKTIQVWVKFDNLPSFNTQGQPVFGKLSSGFGFDGYWGGLFSNTGNTRVVTNGTAVQRITTSTSNPILIDTWYLYTFISQITSTLNTTKVYINTTEISSIAHGADGYSESNPLYLGWIGSGISSPYLNGKIGACYFYTKGLTPSEITQNFNSTKSKYGL
jgi:hypothetical protein